jgi:monoterpene epsilon-lactone hydrolase
MSLRAELVRLGLRWFVKRKIGPETTLDALRRQDAFVARLVLPPPRDIRTTHVDLDGVKAVAIVPPASLGDRVALYLHGGGYVSGSPALYRDFTWRIAAATRARTVILDHRLAPEHPFPAALDDAVTAYRALVADGADPRRMAVLGESSGGGLVLAMLLKLRDEGFHLPAALDRSRADWGLLAAKRRGRSDAAKHGGLTARELLSRRRRSSHPLCVAALRRPDRTAADAHPGRQRRDPAR